MIDVTPQPGKLPIVVLAGFLGSGKTTVLNELLRQQDGVKIAAVVNDFGEVNIDSLLVSKQTDERIELSNGCICCEVDEGGLDATLAGIAHKGTTFQAIVIEASGIAEPADIGGMLLTSNNEYVYFDSIVYVVDGASYHDTLDKHPVLAEHLQAADVILLNKTDLLDDQQTESVENSIRQHNSQAPILRAEHGQVDTRLLLDVEKPQTNSPQLSLKDAAHHDHDGEHTHLHDHYQTSLFRTDHPLDPEQFTQLLNTRLPGVYRMKGRVNFGGKGFMEQFVLQLVGDRWDLKIMDISRNQTPTTELVLIGDSFDETAVTDALQSCIDSDPGTITKDTMLDIMEYERQ